VTGVAETPRSSDTAPHRRGPEGAKFQLDHAPSPIAGEAGVEQGGGDTGYAAVLRNRSFLFIWAAQLLSQTAQNAVNYALVVEVERLTQSSTNVGWVIVSFSLPALLLGPSAGVFVDRVSKRRVLLWTNLLRCVLMAGFLLVPRSLMAIYGVTLVASAVSQFFAPAEGAAIPLMVRKHDLIAATSLFNLTFTGAQVAGFVLLGPTLYKLFGASPIFVAVVVMYALAAVCVTLLPTRERIVGTAGDALRRALAVRAVWNDMLEARRFLALTPGVSLAIGHLALATALLMTLATLGPGFVARVLGLGAEDAGYVLAPAGLGMLITTALLGHFAAGVDRRKLASRGLVAMSASIALLAVIRWVFNLAVAEFERHGPAVLVPTQEIAYLGLVCLVTFSLGIEFACITIPAQTVVSEATEPEIRGRIFALLFMLTGTVSAIPVLIIGALADHLGIAQMLLALAALVAVVGVAGIVVRPGQEPAPRDA
jgi:MFS family permease